MANKKKMCNKGHRLTHPGDRYKNHECKKCSRERAARKGKP